VTLTTVHGNQAIMEAAAAAKATSSARVTVLTSLDRGDLDDLGFACDVESWCCPRAARAGSGLRRRGVVGPRAPKLREFIDQRLLVVTPGIRPVENKPVDDQKRTVDVRRRSPTALTTSWSGARFAMPPIACRRRGHPADHCRHLRHGDHEVSAPLQNDLFLRALLRQPTPRTPLWMMRQAGATAGIPRDARQGRQLPEPVHESGAGVRSHAATARALPPRRAILFSDILTIPHAMNVGLEFEAARAEDRASRPLDSRHRPAARSRPEGELRYVMDAVRLSVASSRARAADRLCGQPLDRGHLHGRRRRQQELPAHQGMMYGAPRELHRLLDVITRATLAYLNAQVAAGAQR